MILLLVGKPVFIEICSEVKLDKDMEYEKLERCKPVCLECGDRIRYGRTDKKFCCDECRNRHYNSKQKEGRTYKRKVLALLQKNYAILEDLLRSGVDSADFVDLLTLGFTPDAVTCYHRSRRHDEFACFDIKYRMSESRIFSISKIQNVSLPLQVRDKTKHQ